MDWKEGQGPGQLPGQDVTQEVAGAAAGDASGAIPAGLESLYGACRSVYADQPNPLQVTALVKYWLVYLRHNFSFKDVVLVKI